MKSKAKLRSNPGAVGRVLGLAAMSLSTVVMASLSIQPVVAAPSSQDNNPGIAPIQSHPDGKTYGQWAAAWWQWAQQTPASTNPLLDKLDKRDCSVGQKGHVWFLGGILSLVDTRNAVVRNCTVPTGTKLFFPLLNTTYGAFVTDPPDQRTEDFLRAQVAFIETPTLLEAKIDGVPVKNPTQYLEKSPLFDVQLPIDNIYEANGIAVPLLFSPNVDEGYYLFVQPLPPGKHTIEWKEKIGTAEQNVTYYIEVKPGRN
jgi:hypothetical protein